MRWDSPYGGFELIRHPFPGEASHRPWDAADLWILEELKDIGSPSRTLAGSRAYIGENFGVLAAVLGPGLIISDSSLALEAARVNIAKNRTEREADEYRTMSVTNALDEPDALTACADQVFIRLPRSLELLEIYLLIASLMVRRGGMVHLGGMSGRWTASAADTSASILGSPEFGRFRKRARWLRFTPDHPLPFDEIGARISGAMGEYPYRDRIYRQYPGIFSSGHPDPGALTFLEHLPRLPAGNRVADLGCGNGILGIETALENPGIEVCFSDVSSLAMQSCRENWHRLVGAGKSTADFLLGNGLKGMDSDSLDAVICNPPFHFANIQTMEVAASMFSDACRCLLPDGMLQVVANSHLGYHKLLKTWFNDVRVIEGNRRFIILRASAPRKSNII